MFRTLLMLIVALAWSGSALAVPEVVSVNVADVTPRSFCLVWMSNQPIVPKVEVFADIGLGKEVTSELKIEIAPDLSTKVIEAMVAKRIYKVRISGLEAGTDYFVRSLSQDANELTSIGYSSVLEVTTSDQVSASRDDGDGQLTVMGNDLLSFKTYLRPIDREGAFAGTGDLLLLESSASVYPITAVAGDGIPSGEAVIDLNNMFDLSRTSLLLENSSVISLRVYRGGTLSSLHHLRKLPAASGNMVVAEVENGWNRADLNLDGIVDVSDFQQFKEQYRLTVNHHNYNPDCDFVQLKASNGAEESIDLHDFAWFAGQYNKKKAN